MVKPILKNETLHSTVGCVRCKSYSFLKEKIRKALDCVGGLGRYIKAGDVVLLKPNLCEPVGVQNAATTHPAVIASVIELVKEITPYVLLGEQSASAEAKTTLYALETCGVMDVLLQTGSQFRNLQEEQFVVRHISEYRVLDKTDFCSAAFEVDCIINLPKFKTHGLTFVTGAIKNVFGLIHPGERQYVHRVFSDRENFSAAIVDIYSAVRPRLTVMDMLVSMEGDEGPSYGNPKGTGYILAGPDGVAVDAVASYITGHVPLEIPMIREAHERNIGTGDISKIRLRGDKPKVLMSFKRHSAYELRKQNPDTLPAISSKCTMCGSCYNNCPVQAITKADGKYSIGPEECIRCLRCIEVCKFGAVRLSASVKKIQGSLDSAKKWHNANIRLGLDCNHKCLFCTVANDAEPTLETKTVFAKIREMAKSGVNNLTITGGEPTTREDLLDIVGFAKKSGIAWVDLQTNGSRMHSKGYVASLVKAGINSFLIALHSHNEEVSNSLTCSKDFHKTVLAVKNAAKTGCRVAVSHVINTKNMKHLTEFAKFISDMAPDAWIYFSNVRPNGRTLANRHMVPQLHMLEPDLYRAMEYCKTNSIKFTVEGVPLCFMTGHESACEETARLLRSKTHTHTYFGGKDKIEECHNFVSDNLKTKSPVCGRCYLNDICVGVWKEYAEIYGTEELFPVFHKLKLSGGG